LIVGFTGHRDKIAQTPELQKILDLYPGATWVHGGASSGFDDQVHTFALANGFQPEVIRPDYAKYHPKRAPLERNKVIVDSCNLLVACYDGRRFGGTFQTINYAKSKGKQVVYVLVRTG
jgi:hypothetical protein